MHTMIKLSDGLLDTDIFNAVRVPRVVSLRRLTS